MKWIVSEILPCIENHKVNSKLKNKLNTIEKNEDTKKEYCVLWGSSVKKKGILIKDLKKLNDSELSRKNSLEDKAKTNVAGITIAITIIMSASDLCNSLYSKFPEPIWNVIVFLVFIAAVLYMMAAGLISIKTIVNENIVYIPIDDGINLSQEKLCEELDIDLGKNKIQNLIRNNNIYTSYQYIRNALICLFLVFFMLIFPLINQKSEIYQEVNGRQYFYSEQVIKFMLKNDIEAINNDITQYIVAMDKGRQKGIYGFINEDQTLFIKIQIEDNKVDILLVETINNENLLM